VKRKKGPERQKTDSKDLPVLREEEISKSFSVGVEKPCPRKNRKKRLLRMGSVR